MRLPAALAVLWCTGGAPPVLATSAGFQGPVELSLRDGAPCAHVAFASPAEAQGGWSLAIRPAVPDAHPPLWSQDTPSPTAARPAPATAALCVPLPIQRLQPDLPYRVELSTFRLYRSAFCWRPAPAPRLLAVDADTGRCTDRPWTGSGGHTLSPPGWRAGWRAAWQRWWHALFDQGP